MPNPATPLRERQRLPNKRPSVSLDFALGNLKYTVSYSQFADGRIGELFISNHKLNSAADTAARDAAIVCSIALQFGAEFETIRKALDRDSQGRAAGALGAALDEIASREKGPGGRPGPSRDAGNSKSGAIPQEPFQWTT